MQVNEIRVDADVDVAPIADGEKENEVIESAGPALDGPDAVQTNDEFEDLTQLAEDHTLQHDVEAESLVTLESYTGKTGMKIQAAKVKIAEHNPVVKAKLDTLHDEVKEIKAAQKRIDEAETFDMDMAVEAETLVPGHFIMETMRSGASNTAKKTLAMECLAESLHVKEKRIAVLTPQL